MNENFLNKNKVEIGGNTKEELEKKFKDDINKIIEEIENAFKDIKTEDWEEKKMRIEKRNILAKELIENQEIFTFSGINQEAYLRMKNEEEELGIYATPIDESITRFEKEGIKVVLGKNPESGNIFILPSQSDDIENDSILIGKLEDNEELDGKIKK